MAINIADFQVPQGESELLSSKVELRGPRGAEDVRVHETWRSPFVAIVRHAGKSYVIKPALCTVLSGYWFKAELRAAYSSKDGFFVWVIRDADETTKRAADAAVHGWTRVTWITKDKDYAFEAGDEHEEPEWSTAKFDDLLEAALNGRVLSDVEDEIVQAVRKKKVQVKTKAKAKKAEEKKEEEKKAKAEK